MLRMQVVSSEDVDSDDAAKELVQKGLEVLGESMPGGMLFFTSLFEADYGEMLGIIGDTFPGVPLVGCTTCGELSAQLQFSEDTSLLIFLCSDSDDVAFATDVVRNAGKLTVDDLALDCRRAAKATFCVLPASCSPKLCLAFPDGLLAYQAPLVEVMGQALGEVPLFGGASADDYRFARTYQFYNREVLTESMPIMTIGGNVKFSFGSAHGWNPVSQLARVTKSEYNKVFEIDNVSVLEYYQRYIGDTLATTPGIFAHFPLIVLDAEGGGSYLRDPIFTVAEEGALIFGGEVPEGSVVRLAEIGRDELIGAVATATDEAVEAFGEGTVAGVLVFSCGSRRNLLGSRVAEESITCLEKVVGVPALGGFYGFGEIAPLGCRKGSILYNGTFVALLVGQEDKNE